MIILRALLFLLPIAPMAVIARAQMPVSRSGGASALFQLAIASGLGLGLSSCSYFFWRMAIGPAGVAYQAAETLLVVAALVWALRMKKGPVPVQSVPMVSARSRWLASAFFIALAGAIFVFAHQTIAFPDGEWDAWTNFNTRARMLYRVDGPTANVKAALDLWPVADYPPMLSALVARGWTYGGSDRSAVPIAIGCLFTFGIVLLVTTSLALLRSWNQGLIGGLLVLCTQSFVMIGAFQYADLPLGFFLLAALALLAVHDRLLPDRPGVLALAGCAAGLAAWTKNDGILLAFVLLLVRAGYTFAVVDRATWRRQQMALLIGITPLLLMLIWYKSAIVGPSELVASQGLHSTLHRLLDVSRYAPIASSFVVGTLRFGPWAPTDLMPILVVWFLLVGFEVRSVGTLLVAPPAITLILAVLGYAIACLISPYDIHWQLDTALFRLQLHLWPSVLWTALLASRPLESIWGGKSSVPKSLDPEFTVSA